MTQNISSSKAPAASASKGSAKSMAELMASYKTSFKTFKKGDLVKGKITKLSKNEILVDIEAKSAAVVLEKEKPLMNILLSKLKVGSEVEVSILNPESDLGNPVVSLRRFLGNMGWGELEKIHKADEQLEVKVTDLTKGGVVVVTESGLSGFLPNSHIGAGLQLSVGKTVKVRVIEISRADNKIIFSQKLTISAKEFDLACSKFKIGESVEATVMNVVPFGIFVGIESAGQQLDGLIHISEVSWDKSGDLSADYTSGQKVKAKIIGFDKNTRRVDLSIKQLTDDPFEKMLANYPVDQKVTGNIVKIDENGVHLEFADGAEGLIRKDKIPPTVSYEEGQNVTATVSEIDKRKRKIYLVPVLLEKPLMYR